ncbi:MAG: glyoxylase-like metal-dependent hydrolase (beta-lactamase superfamily II) [Oceanicoccus sp.]
MKKIIWLVSVTLIRNSAANMLLHCCILLLGQKTTESENMHGGKWKIGDVTVTRIVEMETTGGTRFLLPQATPENIREIDWLYPNFASDSGKLKMSIHALVIEAPGRRIIVDTCIGNDKERAMKDWSHLQTDFLKDLAGEGFDRETIDTVLCTHLHVDHVGWNTMLVDGQWQPTFPNARYLIARTEFEHWNKEGDGDQRQVMEDSVDPIEAAGLIDLVATDEVISDEIKLVPTHGHTPGHVSIQIESRGEKALITGDFVHHPCQMAHPEWAAAVDTDSHESTATRRREFGLHADSSTLIIGTHFATPTAGYIRRDGDVWKLVTD